MPPLYFIWVCFRKSINHEDFELTTYIMGLIGKTISATDLSLARRVLGQVSRQVGRFFEGYDVLLTPTLSEPAPLLGSQKLKEPLKTLSEILARTNATWAMGLSKDLIDQQAQVTFEFIPYPPLFNITGQPAMSVPLYWNAQNIPVGGAVRRALCRRSDTLTSRRTVGKGQTLV